MIGFFILAIIFLIANKYEIFGYGDFIAILLLIIGFPYALVSWDCLRTMSAILITITYIIGLIYEGFFKELDDIK